MADIGDRVSAPGFPDAYVVGTSGAPNGEQTLRLAKPARPRRGVTPGGSVNSADAEALPLPEFAVGAEVYVHAGKGQILGRIGDDYVVLVTRRRPSGLVFPHIYPAVKPHEIALG